MMARMQFVQPDVVHERDATEDGVLERVAPGLALPSDGLLIRHERALLLKYSKPSNQQGHILLLRLTLPVESTAMY